MQNTMPRKLRRAVSCAASSLPGKGVACGLGGILVCSFLGGMRAVTWTQVAQYIILIIAYMTPVVWLSWKHMGNPIPQLAYATALQKLTEREKVLTNDPKEIEVRNILKARADAATAKLKAVPASYAADKAAAEKRIADMKAASAPAPEIGLMMATIDIGRIILQPVKSANLAIVTCIIAVTEDG